jgi:hypothetical protein
LLNLTEQRHVTVVLADFDLPARDRERLRDEVAGLPTTLMFQQLDDRSDRVLNELADAGVNTETDYVSVQALTCTEPGLKTAVAVSDAMVRGDYARLELPWRQSGFNTGQATALLEVVQCADYYEQETVADLLFRLLGRRRPYDVIVRTLRGELRVHDIRPWFELAGRLRSGEQRILPGGEVAYVGESVDGTFTVDGAVLAVAQRAHAAADAARIQPASASLRASPITLEISAGRITEVAGGDTSAVALRNLLKQDAYQTVTEVGISFNRACGRYIHDWPAACNEGHPGVHLGVGGDPDPNVDKGAAAALVHVDLMAANTEVLVNGQLFLRTID